MVKRVLIVEDHRELADLYADIAKSKDWLPQVALSLADAEGRLEETAFAVASVDLSLVKSDPDNRDGLKVLQAIKETGDGTACILVTGYGDLEVGNAVASKYQAEAVMKDHLKEPYTKVPELLEEGFGRFQRQMTSRSRVSAPIDPRVELFRGDIDPKQWEYEMTSKLLSPPDGVVVLWSLAEKLFSRFLPAVRKRNEPAVRVDPDGGLASGEFWSRSHSGAVGVRFGKKEPLEAFVSTLPSTHSVVARAVVSNLSGVVFELPDLPRSEFVPVRG